MRTGNGSVGSNPTLTATLFQDAKPLISKRFFNVVIPQTPISKVFHVIGRFHISKYRLKPTYRIDEIIDACRHRVGT